MRRSNMSLAPVRILLLGTGAMAERHVHFFHQIEGCTIVAGVDVSEARAKAFCDLHRHPEIFHRSRRSDRVGAVRRRHQRDARRYPLRDDDEAHRGGLSDLCEKPLAPTYPEALAMTEAAERAGIVNMVNLRYRGLPVMQKARALVEDGTIGDVRHIDAAYLHSWLVGKHWGDWRTEERWLWRLSSAHGSKGVLGDLGIHILDFAAFVADQMPASIHCRLKTFAKAPDERIGAYGLDANDSFVMSIEFDGGALGVVHATRWAPGYANAQKVGVYGTKGGLEIWFESEKMGLRVCAGEDVHTQTWREVECPDVPNTYDAFVEAVRTGKTMEPSFRRAAELQHVLDLAFESDRLGKALAVKEPEAKVAAE